MEIDEAVARILRRHALLIALTTIALVAGVVLLDARRPDEYRATTRLLVGHGEVRSSVEADAFADRTRAIATSRTILVTAISRAGVDRTPAQLAKDGVTVSRLGTSSVIDLSVTDNVADVATALADEVAKEVVAFLDDATRGELPELLASLDEQIGVRTAQLVASQRANAARAAAGQPVRDDSGVQELQELRRRRDDLIAEDRLRIRPRVVDEAELSKVPSSLVQDSVLAALLGLVVGTGAAAAIETMRPSVVGSRAVARVLGAPLLVDLGRASDDAADTDTLVRRLVTVAERAGLRTVALVGDHPAALTPLARRLEHQIATASAPDQERSTSAVAPAVGTVATTPEGIGWPAHLPERADALVSVDSRTAAAMPAGVSNGHLVHWPPSSRPPELGDLPRSTGIRAAAAAPTLRVCAGEAQATTTPGPVGIVAVVPPTLQRADLERVDALSTLTGWPVIGVVTRAVARRRPTLRLPGRGAKHVLR